MHRLTCTTISSVDLVRYGVSDAKDLGIWGSWYHVLYKCRTIYHAYILSFNTGSVSVNVITDTSRKQGIC